MPEESGPLSQGGPRGKSRLIVPGVQEETTVQSPYVTEAVEDSQSPLAVTDQAGRAKVSEAAMAYMLNGWQVFPLHIPEGTGCSCGKSDCKVGKHPRIKAWEQAFCDP